MNPTTTPSTPSTPSTPTPTPSTPSTPPNLDPTQPRRGALPSYASVADVRTAITRDATEARATALPWLVAQTAGDAARYALMLGTVRARGIVTDDDGSLIATDHAIRTARSVAIFRSIVRLDGPEWRAFRAVSREELAREMGRAPTARDLDDEIQRRAVQAYDAAGRPLRALADQAADLAEARLVGRATRVDATETDRTIVHLAGIVARKAGSKPDNQAMARIRAARAAGRVAS